jgi:uncharacterized protein (TIGR03435 family)
MGHNLAAMRLSVLPLIALTLSAQTPSFEVASIHPVEERRPGVAICGVNLSPQTIVSGSESRLVSGSRELFALISDAHNELVDALDIPQWVVDAGRFAISVKIPPNTNVATCREMLRNLLAERFHLVTAVETRPVGRYYLSVAKSGLKMKPVEKSPADPEGRPSSVLAGDNVHYTYLGVPMARYLSVLTNYANMAARARGYADDPSFQYGIDLVDETGLTGYYDANFGLPIRPPAPDGLAESLEASLTDQLGLTLEFRKAPGKVLVIRSGDRMPTEN